MRLVYTHHESMRTFGMRVRARHVRGGLRRRVRAVAGVRAGVRVERDLAGDDPPVVHHAVLDVDALGRARRGDLHLLVAVVDVLDRLVRGHRGDARDRLDGHVDLAAEAAADRAADDLQLAERHVEDERRVVQGEEARLRVRVDLQAAVVLGLDDAARGLRRRLLDRLRLVLPLEDVVGLREALLHVAEAHAPAVVALVLEPVRAVRLERVRVGLDRLLDVEDRLEVLVGHLDGGRALARGALARGHHGHDRLAAPEDLLLGQHDLVLVADVDELEDRVPVVRHVLCGSTPSRRP